MPTRPAQVAEDVVDSVADTVKSMIDRLVDAELTREVARRGQDVAGVIAERGADVGERASEAWRETAPIRRDASKRVSQATGEAAKWSDGLWKGSVAPVLKDLWQRRTVAVGAAGAAVPASRDLLESAAVRLGLKERQRDEERRRWGVFFLGMALGAIAGAAVALLTTPKRGSEVRRQLGERAEEVRRELAVKADEIAAKAREAEWMPVFQRDGENGNGNAVSASQALGEADSLQESAAESGATAAAAAGEDADRAASDTAGAINEAYDVDRETVDRESPA